ncbi:hypothetical protein [uncultured Eubacterium sp.]|uniref:hypothetical protein n=1 Tax=uncultured Eubacterium sp. TaxID=165185 RepID=UPI0025E522E7|nr:hypothetical protein [uncultured Eubacterium sp.]
MNVRFIDTSVMTNMLEIPGRCSDTEKIQKEFKQAVEANEVLILPIATIIETGNHIAHIADSNARRSIAGKFGEYLRKTAEGEAPWQLYGIEIDKEGLLYLANHIEENASYKIGIGDMSIIHAYEQYRDTVPGIGRIMIWSTDTHLQGYYEENVSVTVNRRRKRS